MNENQDSPARNERRGLSIAALMMSVVALLCAFVVSWRGFAIIIAIVALLVAILVLAKVVGPGRSKSMSLIAIFLAVLAICVAAYFLATNTPEYGEEKMIPAELHDTAATGPDAETLDRLRMSMDSTQQGE